MYRTQFRWKSTKREKETKTRKWHQIVLLITNTCDIIASSTVANRPVERRSEMQGKLLPPGGKRNENLHRATLNSTPLPSRTSCTRFAPPWRHHWSAGRRTSPPWTPGCPLIRKKGWCCWEETRQSESGSILLYLDKMFRAHVRKWATCWKMKTKSISVGV